MKKAKIIKGIIAAIVVLIVVIIALIAMFGNRALKTGIETAGSKTLNVDVTLEKISLSIFAGAVELNDLIIANPEGYQNPNLLEAGRVKVDVELASLMSDTVNIEDMIFEDITIVVEQKGLTNNLQEILDSMPKADEDAEPVEKEPAEEEKPAKNLVIKNLELNDIQVKVKLLPLPGKADTIPLKLAPIKMTDLGTDSKLDMAKLTAKILVAIAEGIAKDGVGLIPDDIIGPMKDVLGEGAGALIESGKELLENGKGAGNGIIESIKGLFPTEKD